MPRETGQGGAAGLDAVIFDVDGTLAETERDGHRVAFNRAFARHGLSFRWNVPEYGALLRITGGRRRLSEYLGRVLPEAGQDQISELAARLHTTKTAEFASWIAAGKVRPRPGVTRLIDELVEHRVRLAIATTGSRAWVGPLLSTLFPGRPFEVVVTGDDVRELKPHPEGYLRALRSLGLPADRALAVEDSVAGLHAARGAGLGCLAVRGYYTREDVYPDALAVFDGYDDAHDWLRRRILTTCR